MKKLISAVIFLSFITLSYGSTPAKLESITKGGRVDTNIPGLTKLTAGGTSGGGPRFSPFRTEDGTDYQVPSGKTLRILFLETHAGAVAFGVNTSVGYASTAVATINSASAPTSPIFMGGADPIATALEHNFINSNGVDEYAIPDFTVQASSYPFMMYDAVSRNTFLWGIEE